MKRLFFGFAAAAVIAAHFLAAPSRAQTANSLSGAASNATSGSNAVSGSVSGATGGNSTATNAATNAAGASTGPATVNFSTGNNSPYTVNNPAELVIKSAPTIYAPSVITGNVCALGASAGASWLGAGITLGGTWESEQCENRHRVALLFNMGQKAAALELACDTRPIYEAMKRTGTPCVPRPEWEPKVANGPVAPPRVQPVAQPAPRMAFNASMYASASECLTAASAAGAPFSSCAGKK